MRVSVGFSVVVAALATAGCHKAFRTSVTQPNPLSQPLETLRESKRLLIVTGDMELEVPSIQGSDAQYGGAIVENRRYPLKNTASFTVVSRDRLRFHVQFEHKWMDYAKLKNWNAYLIDDRGRTYLPEEVDSAQPRHVVYMWDREIRTARRNAYGDVVAINDDGHRRRQTLGSLSLFRGRGDLVFYSRDIFTPDIRAMTLVLERGGVTFEYTWRFADDALAPPGTGERPVARADTRGSRRSPRN